MVHPAAVPRNRVLRQASARPPRSGLRTLSEGGSGMPLPGAPCQPAPLDASWSSPTLGTSEGRPTISGSTDPTVARSREV